MKVKKILAMLLSICMLAGCFSVTVYAQGSDINGGQILPSDLLFNKFYTGRNIFNMELPINSLNLDNGTYPDENHPVVNATENGLNFNAQNGQMTISNPNDSLSESYLKLGDYYPYLVTDLEVIDQNGGNGQSVSSIEFAKDRDNRVAITYGTPDNSEDEDSIPESATGDLITSIDMASDFLNNPEHSIEKTTANGTDVSKADETLVFSNAMNQTCESIVRIGELSQQSVIIAGINEQVKNKYTANALIHLGKDPGNRIIVAQRTNGTLSIEVFKDGKSVTNQTLKSDGIAAPYTLKLKVDNNILTVFREKDGVEEKCGSLDVSPYIDLTDPAVAANYDVYVGARLGINEKITFSKADIYEMYSDKEEILNQIDMSSDFLNSPEHSIAVTAANGTDVTKGDNSVVFSNAVNETRESIIRVGPLSDNSVIIADVASQVKNTYTANALIHLGSDPANRVVLAQRCNGTMTIEVFKDGKSVTNKTLISNGLAAPYTLKMAVQGNLLTVYREKDGQEEICGSLDMSPYFDFTDPEIAKNFDVHVGARLGINEKVEFSQAKIIKLKKPVEIKTDYNGYWLRIYKNGSVVYEKQLDTTVFDGPYTLRVTQVGQYLNFWKVIEGKPYYLATEDISSYFNMRDSAVYEDFDVYIGARLPANTNLTIAGAEQYLTGGDGQADPKPIHNSDGTILCQDNKIWLTMSIRGYGPLPDSFQGIYSIDLETFEVELVSTVISDKGDGVKRQYYASDICYNPNTDEWYYITTSHGEDHKLYYGQFEEDPRNNKINEVKVSLLEYPSVSNEEDASLIYDEQSGKWRLAYCKNRGGYQLQISESDSWNGPYTEIYTYEQTSCTGIMIQKIYGKYWVFTGRGNDSYDVLTYPELEFVGNLQQDRTTGNSYNVWPVMLPLTIDGETKYFMLSFDRNQVDGISGYSYGRLYLYEAELPFCMRETQEIETEDILTAQIDMSTDFLNNPEHSVEKTTANGADVTQDGNTLVISNSAGDTRESIVRVGKLENNITVEAEISEQINKSYTANALIHFGKDAGNRIIIAQRSNGAGNKALSAEIFQNGKSVKMINLRSDSAQAPYTLKVTVNNSVLEIYRIKDSEEQYCGSFDVSEFLDLSDPETAANYDVYVGARLGNGEKVAFSKALITKSVAVSPPDFSGNGSGTVTDPYVITSASQLDEIRNKLDANYILNNSIDLSGYDNWTPIGTKEVPFTGSLNGNGYKITGLNIDSPEYKDNGLFGYTSNSSNISNLNVIAKSINGHFNSGVIVGTNYGTISSCYAGGEVTGYSAAGIIAGTNYGTITKCSSNGTVSLTGTANAGGITGNNKGTVTECYSSAAVDGKVNVGGLIGYNDEGKVSDCYAYGNTSGSSYIGGLIGNGYNGSVTNCYAYGNVSGTINVGGLMGFSDGKVNNSFAVNTVSGSDTVGGLIGRNNINSSILNSYAATDTSSECAGSLIGENYGLFDSCAAIGGVKPIYNIYDSGKVTSDLPNFKSADTYADGKLSSYDMQNIWNIDSEINNGYPYLINTPEIIDSIPVTAATDKSVYEVNSEFIVTITTPDNVSDISIYNEYGNDIGKRLVDIIDNNNGSFTFKYAIKFGTKGDRTINIGILENGSDTYKYATQFNVKIAASVAMEEIDAQINSAYLSNGTHVAIAGHNFNLTVVTNKGVSDIALYNEYGSQFGKTLVNKTVDGDNIIWEYSLNIGSKGMRTITVKAYDYNCELSDAQAQVKVSVVK